MIVVDSSALVAILKHEPERVAFFEVIAGADRRLISAVIFQETSQVIFSRFGEIGLRELHNLLESMQAEVVPHDEALAVLATEAFQRYGKGIHPKARLNLGDCAA